MILIVIGIVILILLVVVIVLLLTQKSDSNVRFYDLNKTLDDRLHKESETINKQFSSQFESSKKYIQEITRELTEVKATGKQMLSFTKQLQSLENTLKNPQRRGALGEYILEQVISNVLPPANYQIQYTFKNGLRADAVVFLQDKKKISIDSKFSLDNYTRLLEGKEEDVKSTETMLRNDLKKRIIETTKYIIPEEGTLDFAFMFIPSEALYYDLLTQKIGGDSGNNMIEYAFNEHRVIIISPTTLLAYLQTVNIGLRGLKIEEHTKEIIKHVNKLQTHFNKYTAAFKKIGKNLDTTVNKYNEAQKQYELIDKDLLKITDKGGKYKRDVLVKPELLDEEL